MKFKNKKYGFKRFLVGWMLALSVFSTSFLVSNFNNFNTNPVYANFQEVQTSISNNDFSSYSTSTDPYTPNNWTYNNPLNNESIKNGVINVYDTVFPDKKTDYELTDNPNTPAGNPTAGSADALYKHLMINSYAGFGRAGYSSSSFNLEANSYYSITVTLKTTNQAKASVYLSGLSDKEIDSKITNITTFNSWATYTIFVETNEFTSENATLELWLGSKEENDTCQGAAFFNKVSLTKYSESTFRKNVSNSDKNLTKIITLFNPVYEDLINNANFNNFSTSGDTNAITDWTTVESSHDENQMLRVISTANYNAEVDTEKDITNPGINFKSDDTNVLFMYNKKSGVQAIKSNEFTIKQNELYMISVWAKSDCGVGSGANIKVEEVNENEDDEDEEFTANTATITTSTSISTNATTNNWTQYKIFVEGHPLKDTKATLQIWLGTKDANSDGYVFVDDISVQRISYATYTNGSTSGNNATYTFNANNTQFLINNGNFNVAQKPETELSYPLKVSNWALTSEDEHYAQEQNLCGTINTKTDQFKILTDNIANKNLGITVRNPGLTPIQSVTGATLDNSSNNVLMIGNTIKTSQNYVSDSFSLTASGYTKISMLVSTQFNKNLTPQENTGVQIKLSNSSYSALNVYNIDTNGEWQKINFYVHVGSLTDYTLTLALNNVQGFAFFDDVMAVTSTEEEFNAEKGINDYKVELNVETNDTFDLHDNTSVLNTLYNWKATNHTETTDSLTYGALDTSKNTSTVFTGINNPLAPTGNNVLAIHSGVDTHFTMAATQKIDLSIDSYYKITVKVKTLNISQEEQNHKYDKKNKLIQFGATISLNGFDKKFTAINTERDDIDGYGTYTFYIKPTEDTQTYIELGLGDTDNLASGYVFFDDVVVTTLQEAAYNEGITDKSNRTLLLTEKSTDKKDTEEAEDFTGAEFNWVIVPSILLSLAIIIAIVGSTIRKFKFTKTPKIKTKYDRRKTVEVDLNKRERIELRNEIIKELNNEYGDIDKEINNLVEQFEAEKAEIQRIHEEKIKAYEKIKQAILIDRENATREYNNKLNSTENLTEADKTKYEKEFKAYINKLDKRSNDEAKKFGKKDRTIELIELKHIQKVKVLTDRQKYIQEEIARIEREIEEIAKQEEIMWNEYRKAKEDAKKQKLEYLAEKRKTKEETKSKKNNVSNETENSDNVIQEDISTQEETSLTNNNLNNDDVEIVEPNEDEKK